MSSIIMRSRGVLGALIWIALLALMLHDAIARTPLHAPVYFENAKPKRVVKRFKKKTPGRCFHPGTKRWAKGVCE